MIANAHNCHCDVTLIVYTGRSAGKYRICRRVGPDDLGLEDRLGQVEVTLGQIASSGGRGRGRGPPGID